MSKFDAVLKSEITRLVRKELKQVVVPLNRQIRSLSKKVRLLSKQIEQAARQPRGRSAAPAAGLEASVGNVESARISGGLIQKLRKRLGITQSQLAGLVGVSPAAVQSWEQGIARPAGQNKAAIIALRQYGRRDIARLMEERGVAQSQRRPRSAGAAEETPAAGKRGAGTRAEGGQRGNRRKKSKA